MEDCLCGEKAAYLCSSCKVFICEEHKDLHEKNKKKAHVFEEIFKHPDSSKPKRIVENLILKISLMKRLKEIIVLETETIIEKIESLCMNALDAVELRIAYYMKLLKVSQQRSLAQDFTEADDQLALALTLSIPDLNFREIQEFYNHEFAKESIKCQMSAQRLENLRYLPTDDVKQALEQECSLFLEAHTDSVYCIAVTMDNKYIISGSVDKTIRIWDLQNKIQDCILRGHSAEVKSVAVTRDSKFIVSGSFDTTIRIWDLQNKMQTHILTGHTDRVRAVAITSDNKYIVSASKDNSVRIWKLENKTIFAVMEGHTREINSVIITNDDKYVVSASDDKTIRIWSIQAKATVSVLQGHSLDVTSLAITSDGMYLISSSLDMSIRIWNFQRQKLEAELSGHRGGIWSVAITNDNNYIVSGSADCTIRIWSIRERKQMLAFNAHNDCIAGIVLSSDNEYISGYKIVPEM